MALYNIAMVYKEAICWARLQQRGDWWLALRLEREHVAEPAHLTGLQLAAAPS